MKISKRILSVFLALALAAGIFAPCAFAQEAEQGVNWEEFYFITQPQDTYFFNGDSFTLSVEVNAPEGVELSYQWVPIYNEIGVVDTQTLTIDKDDPRYPSLDSIKTYERDFYCEVTAIEKNADGKIISRKTIESERAKATIKMNAGEGLKHIFISPWSNAAELTLALMGLTFGIFLPFAPVVYIGSYFFCFGTSVKEVIESSKA